MEFHVGKGWVVKGPSSVVSASRVVASCWVEGSGFLNTEDGADRLSRNRKLIH